MELGGNKSCVTEAVLWAELMTWQSVSGIDDVAVDDMVYLSNTNGLSVLCDVLC